MTVINGFIIIKDAQGRDILVDWDVNSDESTGIRIDTEGEIAIWTDIVNRVNAYDANQAEIKALRATLVQIAQSPMGERWGIGEIVACEACLDNIELAKQALKQ